MEWETFSAREGRAGAIGSKPGSHMEGAVGRAIGVFSKENGEHSDPSGGVLPEWDWQQGGHERSAGIGWACSHAGPQGAPACSGGGCAMLGEPANVRRQARTSVQRGAQNLAAAMKCCQKKRRVTTATPVGLGFGATEVDDEGCAVTMTAGSACSITPCLSGLKSATAVATLKGWRLRALSLRGS